MPSASYERVRKVAESGQTRGVTREYRKRVLSKARPQEERKARVRNGYTRVSSGIPAVGYSNTNKVTIFNQRR